MRVILIINIFFLLFFSIESSRCTHLNDQSFGLISHLEELIDNIDDCCHSEAHSETPCSELSCRHPHSFYQTGVDSFNCSQIMLGCAKKNITISSHKIKDFNQSIFRPPIFLS